MIHNGSPSTLTSVEIRGIALQDLRVDAVYRNTGRWNNPDDVFNRLFRFFDKGINNTSGFRPKSTADGDSDICKSAFCLLITNFEEPEWPDQLDRESGIFTYFGDNRKPGRAINQTNLGGNRLLERVYTQLHTGTRSGIQPFLVFENVQQNDGRYMKFLGLACPGAQGVSALEDLTAVWRVQQNDRFPNYRAIFTILRQEIVHRAWLEDLVAGVAPVKSKYCPPTWRTWVRSGRYTPLECTRQQAPRPRAEQLPTNALEWSVLRFVREHLTPREFEFAARDLVQLLDSRFTDLEVTRHNRDGGRDVVARYRVGHDLHQVLLNAYAEAKSWDLKRAVGVKEMMRLISRIKHRDIGVFVTTCVFDHQVQQELIEDRHPVLLISGGDIARLLISKEMGDPRPGGKLATWVEQIKRMTAEATPAEGVITSA